MPRQSLESAVKEALEKEPKTIRDRLYLLAYVWSKQDFQESDREFLDRLGKLYTFLLKHYDPDSVIRIKEMILSQNPALKEKFEDTDPLRREILENQPSLINLKELGKQKVAEVLANYGKFK